MEKTGSSVCLQARVTVILVINTARAHTQRVRVRERQVNHTTDVRYIYLIKDPSSYIYRCAATVFGSRILYIYVIKVCTESCVCVCARIRARGTRVIIIGRPQILLSSVPVTTCSFPCSFLFSFVSAQSSSTRTTAKPADRKS